MTQRSLGRLAWALALASFGLFSACLWVVLSHRNAIGPLASADLIDLVAPFTFGLVGAVVASRRSENPIGWLFLGMALIAGVSGLGTFVASANALSKAPVTEAARWGAWVQNWITTIIFPAGLLLFVFLLFPDGRLPGPRWRWLVRVGVVFSIIGCVLSAIDPSPMALPVGPRKVANPLGVHALGRLWSGSFGGTFYLSGMALLLLGVIALVRRMRRSSGEERQQLKWFAYSALGTVVALVLASLFYLSIHRQADLPFNIIVAAGFGVAVPTACGVAVLKYGLYEIDVVINRTVVFGALVAFMTAVYVGIVVGIGAAVGSKGNVGLSVLATAIVAVAFQPVRERASRLANRLVYGKRATPYEVLSEFAGRMAATYSLDDVLPRTARILAEATGAARADVWLRAGGELRPGARWPTDAPAATALRLQDGQVPEVPGSTRTVPVRHHGELLGALSLARPAGETLSPAEDKLLADVASQAGLVLRNVGLIQDLRASRQRLVAAQDAERRRLERNIHDGAQQQLVALAVKLRLVKQLGERDPAKATALLDQLEGDVGTALEDLRDLARGIYPPLLADKGLVAALDAQARRAPFPVEIAAQGIGRYPQETEAAVYFCTLEALQNVAKYAGATRADVRLAATNGDLRFEVRDDGRGFDPATLSYGTGLQGMADRLSALGGELDVRSEPGKGTVVAGRLPSVSGDDVHQPPGPEPASS